MLTGNLVRIHSSRNLLMPRYLDTRLPEWIELAEHLLCLFRTLPGKSRSEMNDELDELLGDDPTKLVHLGLAKLLEDRCQFEVEAAAAPEQIRERIFQLASQNRVNGRFDRQAVVTTVATELGLSVEQLERSFFADLKAEQRIISFDDCTAEQLLNRYNVALAQAVLLRATNLTATISDETPVRYRRLFRAIKFHRLICELRSPAAGTFSLQLDGPMSLFSATQKYGVQLANFLPSLLQCTRFELEAKVLWGAQRKEKRFRLSSAEGLVSHTVDYGQYIPKELSMFAEALSEQSSDWILSAETSIQKAGTLHWVPDFMLTHKPSQKNVFLEIFGYWRKTDVAQLLLSLEKHCRDPFILAVSQQMNVEERIEQLDERIYIFKKTPVAEEIIRRAEKLIGVSSQS